MAKTMDKNTVAKKMFDEGEADDLLIEPERSPKAGHDPGGGGRFPDQAPLPGSVYSPFSDRKEKPRTGSSFRL